MNQIIHVNQHLIKHNRKTGNILPVLTIKDYKRNRKANRVKILDKDRNVIAEVVYSPDKPLKCGAVCWITTKQELILE